MASRDYITVEELNFYINNVFLNEELLHNVPVVGEVSGVSFVNGHCYFTLKDEKAQIRCVFFSCPKNQVPTNGSKVLLRGSVDFYAKGGQVDLKVYAVVNIGVGLLHERFEKLRSKLEEEGFFREEHKKTLPQYPQKVCVVTSVKGAAIQDFITTVRRYNEIVDITVIDVRVQGEYCPGDVVEALTNADDYGFDVIVLARGGGSYEDLFYFNDERIVRTIYNLNTPIISAIGHESDYTLCDYVADYRAITPTAAAEIIGYSSVDMRKQILSKVEQMRATINNRVKGEVDSFISLSRRLQLKAENAVENEIQAVMSSIGEIKRSLQHTYTTKEQELSHLLSVLETLNPLKLLNKGYFRIISDNEYVYEVKELRDGQDVTIVGSDGKVNAIICGGAKK
ncbi:MAG: exodeoxyribonuclease VII large subunit [Clostridia bacterium]|nr:exodeoxyribonuclease VII large subunit [Clostridia bacterium]